MGSDEEEEGLVPLEETTSATLSNNPRSLHLLWQEYKFGINGRKPAERFNREERNKKETRTKILSQKSYLANEAHDNFGLAFYSKRMSYFSQNYREINSFT